MRDLRKREEAFELRSRDDGDRGTFWAEDDIKPRIGEGDRGSETRILAANPGNIEAGEGNIVKNVSVSVTADDSAAGSSSPQKVVHDWQND